MELSNQNSVAVLAFSPSAGYPRLAVRDLDELNELLDRIEAARLFEGVVIAANTNSFATGAEITEVAAVEGYAARKFAESGQSTSRRVASFPLPVVAAIRGYCLGGGLDLALACHARVASFDASFGHPGASLGLVTGWGGTERMPRLVGKAAALQMFLTADRIPATQALTMGLVDMLVPSPDLIDAAAAKALALRDAGLKWSSHPEL
jgi:enoyl-CoA hydratase/carnithine racemase